MELKERHLLRQAMEIQYRHKLYIDPAFRYYRSMGILDIFQAFGNKEIGFIGYLHLKWVRDDFYEAIWYDTMEEGNAVKQKVADEHPLDADKLVPIFLEAMNGGFKEKWTKTSDDIILN